jgi:hypothetical protein
MDTSDSMQCELTESERRYFQKTLNGINEDLVRGMLHAEKQLQTKHKNSWSPKLIQARQKLIYWKLWWTELTTNTDLNKERKELAQSIKWKDAPLFETTPTRATIKCHIRGAAKAIRHCEMKLLTMRDEHLMERAEYWALQDNKGVYNVLASMRASEASQQMFRKFKVMEGKTNSGDSPR